MICTYSKNKKIKHLNDTGKEYSIMGVFKYIGIFFPSWVVDVQRLYYVLYLLYIWPYLKIYPLFQNKFCVSA